MYEKLSQEQINELNKKNIKLHMSEINNYKKMLQIIGLNKMVELYNHYNQDFEDINQLLSNDTYFSYNVYDDENEIKERIRNAEVKEIKQIFYEYFKNKIINSRIDFENLDWHESFKNLNADLFLINVNIPEEVKKRYLKRELTIRDLVEYSEIFKDISIENFVNETIYNYVGDYLNLLKVYPDIFVHLEDNNKFDKFNEFLKKYRNHDNTFIKAVKQYAISEKFVDNYSTTENIPKWLSSMNFQVVEKFYDPKELLEFTDFTIIKDIHQRVIIDHLGLENIKRFEQETGFFTHEVPYGNPTAYFDLFTEYYIRNKYFGVIKFDNGALPYNEFLPRIAKCFGDMRKKFTINSKFNYDFIQGKFRDDYPEIFIDTNAPKELREAFYENEIYPKLISEHQEYIPFLLDKNLGDVIKTIGLFAEISTSANNDAFKDINFIELYSSKYGNENCLQLISKYGRYLNNIGITILHNEHENKRLLEQRLRDAIFNKIRICNINYMDLHNDPEFFLEHPDLFIANQTKIPKEIINKFYNRNLSVDDFTSNLNLIEYFKDTNIAYGFSFDMLWVANIYENDDNIISNYAKLKIISMYNDIKIDDLKNAFKSAIIKDWKNINIDDINEITYIINNITNFEHVNQYLSLIGEEKRNNVLNSILNIISYSDCDFVSDLIKNKKISSKIAALKIIYMRYSINNIEIIRNILMKSDNIIDTSYIDLMYEIINRLSLSNSNEMSAFKVELADQILNSDNPIEILNEIEDIFIKNNLPTVGKTYSCFETLHPDFKGFNFDHSMVSPVLKNSSLMGKKFIVFADLIKASFGSNNRSVNEYLKNIEIGTTLYNKIKSGQIEHDKLSEIEKNELMIFSRHLATLYNNTLKGKKNEEPFIFSGNIIQDIFELTKKLSPDGTLNYKLEDRIIRMFCGFAGINTLDEAKNYVRVKVQNADNRNREAGLSDMVLEKGDFIKGVGTIEYLDDILQNGSVSREYLGASADSDRTPLDADVSMIMDSFGSVSEKIDKTVAKSFGPIWFVLKNDDRFITTRDDSGELDAKRDMTKLEVFYTGVQEEGHYGIRTGFASSDINYIVMEEYDPRVGLEIVMNGFYIPVANTDGKIIFTPKNYDDLREKMNGLSYYDMGKYVLDELIYLESKEINDILSSMEENKMETEYKANLIKNRIENALSELGLKLKDKVDLNNGSATLFNTGSTGRFTNLPGDGDFDYIMQIDNNIYLSPDKMNELRNKLIKMLSNGEKVPYDIVKGDIRELKTTVKDENGNEYPVEIDITFSHKTDKTEYASDVCVSDRLNNINSEEERNLVKANIIFAKKFLKSISAYKPARKFPEQGGLGGIGVENWILQNGGSFYSAAKSFVEVANNCSSFEEFKKTYSLPNFGFNHLAVKRGKYPHDNYVDNMNETGYNKMKQALNEYINNYEYNQSVNKSGVK